MKKLKKQKITNLVNYQQFLKNNSLKKKQFILNNILFENPILYNNENSESYVIEYNYYKNIYLPFTLIKIAEISTIGSQHENVLLFNYDLTSSMVFQFNKIMFKNILKKKDDIIQGRLLGGNRYNKKIFVSILGLVFIIKSFNLSNSFKSKKKYFNKNNKRGFYKKKTNSTHLINYYKLKYINFKLIDNNRFKKNVKKKELSRILYLKNIIEEQKNKNEKYSFKKNKC